MNRNKEQNWGYWFILPLYPYQQRATLRYEVVPDTIWTFEQPHGLFYAVVPIRMTVIKLEQGGLLVYAPIAPTIECLKLVRELESKHGLIKYIIHPTSSGLEHKIFVGPFARCFPQAQVLSAPHQWSFPLNLPLSWLGFPAQRTSTLPLDDRQSPLADEFAYEIIDIDLSQGYFTEIALLHKSSQTLLLTDTLVKIPTKPPDIIQLDCFPLLFHARETALDNLEDNPTNRLKGWQRICLFALYFRPYKLETVTIAELLRGARQAPNRSRENYFGLFPFRWQLDWQKSFEAITNQDQPFVAPILQTLILPQAPRKVIDWAEKISLWQFKRVIPAHFQAPINLSPSEFRQAFSFLENQANSCTKLYPSGNQQIYNQDTTFIRQLEQQLTKWGIAKPPQPLV